MKREEFVSDNGKSFEEYVLEMYKLHIENGFKVEEFNILAVDETIVDLGDGVKVPKKLALSIVVVADSEGESDEKVSGSDN